MSITDIIKAYTFLFASALFAVGCSSEKEPDPVTEGVPTQVSVAITALSAPRLAPASGDGTPVDPASDDERIKSWLIAFVDRTGKIARIVSRSDAETGIAADAAAVESETFKCIVPTGNYDLYAFANITRADIKQYAGIDLVEDAILDRAGLENAAWSQNLNLHAGPVPMSGVLKGVKVNNTIEETFSIEVVRMLAKVEFTLTNNSGAQVKVNSISISPITTSAISLFPMGPDGISYDHLGQSDYKERSGAEYGEISSPLEATLADGGKATASFRIQEGISKSQNGGGFTIGLKVAQPDGLADLQQYGVTRDIRGYINRNDLIRIPIELTQYSVTIRALFYPPIGGYPAFMETVDPDGSQVFTFGTQGEFAIVAEVIDKKTGQRVAPERYEVGAVSCTDTDNIFTSEPTLSATSSALPPEILGRLSTNEGSATVTVTLKITDDNSNIRSITRTLYIVRDNNAK